MAVNITAVQPSDSTYVTAFPTGEARPTASTLNPAAGATASNMAIVKLGESGSISLYNARGQVNLIVDVMGWFPVGASYTGLDPARLADTRPDQLTVDNLGPRGAAGAGATIEVPVVGRGGVPATGAGAVAVNITAVQPTANTYITAFPTGGALPTASTLNPAAGATASNMAVIKIGERGSISLYNARGEVNLIVDVLGWMPTGTSYTGLDPARLADTRPNESTIDDLGPRGAVGPGATIEVPAAGRGGVPATGVSAVAVNITAVQPTANTYITAFPTGGALPTASTLNPAAGATASNMAIVKIGERGSISLYNARGEVNLIVDVLGWMPDTQEEPEPTATIVKWGADLAGSAVADRIPTAVSPLGALAGKQPVSVSAGKFFACAHADDGTAACWGSNSYGELGDGTTQLSATPVAVALTGALAGKKIASISAGSEHACATTTDGTAACWGANAFGQLGNGTTDSSTTPVAVRQDGVLADRKIATISAGDHHTCATTQDGGAACWGDDSKGQLGDLGTESSTVPVLVGPDSNLDGKQILTISAGDKHSCATAADGTAACWGDNAHGELGAGIAYSTTTPINVVTDGVLKGKKVQSVSAGAQHTCAATTDGTVACWGAGTFGQLGDDLFESSNVPVAVLTDGPLAGKKFATVDTGLIHSCATTTDGVAACWGNNASGQIGDGSDGPQGLPVPVDTSGALVGLRVTTISAGGLHTFALTAPQSNTGAATR